MNRLNSTPEVASRQVLIVDEQGQVDIYSKLLDQHHHVERASSYDEVITFLNKGHSVDLVITDLVFDGQQDGYRIIKYVRERFQGSVQIWLRTTDLSPNVITTGHLLGASRVIDKDHPFMTPAILAGLV